MSWIVAHISHLMTISGVLTLTMIYAAIAPEAALKSSFGETLNGPVASIVVRNWGALIGLIGAMLIYGARNPAVRPLVLTIAASSKAIFIALVLSQGGRFSRTRPASRLWWTRFGSSCSVPISWRPHAVQCLRRW